MPTKAVSLNVDKSGSFAAQTVRISQGDENSTSIVATILDGRSPSTSRGSRCGSNASSLEARCSSTRELPSRTPRRA